jgi:HD-GYP domain-containing protein (c-di-GMP phosphodiesterase class II)
VSTSTLERVSRAEIVGALSLATDVAMSLPLETGLRICRLALALAEHAGIDESQRDRIYYVALLRHVGCTAEVHSFSAVVGDELSFHDGASRMDATSPKAMAAFTLRHIVRTNGLLGAAGKLAQIARSRAVFDEGVVAVCEVAELLAEQLGLSEDVQHDLALTVERWDGKSFRKRAREEGVPASVRVVQIAECAVVFDGLGGPDAARAVVRERAGGAFDPRIADVFVKHAETLLAPTEHLWGEVVADPAYEAGPLADADVDAALAACAQFVDLKSPFTVGHSSAVARLAQAAGEQAGLPVPDAVALGRSGVLHDLGMVGVPSPVFEKRGPLTTDERERVRVHTYQGERIVARSPALSALGAVASRHHERCDGSGYHRGLDARAISHPARLLAAADAYQSMTEERPHRAALSAGAAAGELRAEARAGRLDGDAVECVLAAATGRPRRRAEHPGGLTSREVEVLRLLARGLSTKQVAAELVITPKTADSHIQHVYSKIGVSTRAAATIFAMRHDLVDASESSGELPM